MKFLILFAALVAAAQAWTYINQPDCGKVPLRPPTSNIVGGQEAINGGHPYIVSMEYGNGVTFSHSCGGTLIHPRWVLTAAHCVAGRPNAGNYNIKLGAHNRAAGQTNAWQVSSKIDKVISHPSYNSANFRNDVALLRLSAAVQYDTNYIQPACLYDNSESIADGSPITIAGWGSTFAGGSVVTTLRDVNIPLTSNATCTGFYGTSYDSTTMICFGIQGDNKDSCQGDSGGPNGRFLSDGKWYNMGVTSWGRGCGDIGVCARVANYLSWIDTTIDANQ